MAKTTRTLAQSIARNSGKTCNADGCYRLRDRVGSHCKFHATRIMWYGHWNGRNIKSTEYRYELLQVRTFIKAHVNHPGVHAAIGWLDDWMQALLPATREAAKLAPPAIETMYRLKAHGVTPQRILEEAIAVWLYSSKYPSKLVDDQRLTFAMSWAIGRLAPRNKIQSWTTGRLTAERMKVADLKGIGRRIRDTIGVLCLNVIDALQSQEDHRNQLKLSMAAPFTGVYREPEVTAIDTTYLLNQERAT